MKALILTIVSATGLFAISGCASDPAADAAQRQALSQHFVPLQAHQTSDLALSCNDLKNEIAGLTADINSIDQKIAYQEKATNSFSLIGALASVSGAYAPNFRSAQLASAEGSLANAGAQIESNQTISTKDLRAMYENRHDVLMQIFYGKNCS